MSRHRTSVGMKAGRKHLVASVVVAALSVAACGGDDDTAAQTTADHETTPPTGAAATVEPADTTSGSAAGEPVRGGTLTVALGGDPVSINPPHLSNFNREVTPAIVESLLWVDPDTLEILPWLAESYEANDTNTAYTFKLREGITFSDGTPLTADVLKANFDDLVANAANIVGAATLLINANGYEATEVLDEYTFTQTFAHPAPGWPVTIAANYFGILAPATLELPYEERADAVVGTGPFLLESYAPNSEVVLVRRDGYNSPPPGASNPGDAYLDRIVFRVVPEGSLRTGTLVSDEVGVAVGLSPADLAFVRESGAEVVTRVIPRIAEGIIVTSADRAPLDDVGVRQALVKGVDLVEIRDTVLSPEYALPTSFFTPGVIGYSDQSDLLVHDPEGASGLLDAAGWVPAADGIRERDGERLSLVLCWIERGNAFDQALTELVQDQYARIGIGVQIEVMEQGQLVERLLARDFCDLLLQGNSGGIEADESKPAITTEPPNFYNIQEPQLQPLLAAQANETDPAARSEIWDQIQELIISTGIAFPLVEDTAFVGVAAEVHGFELLADSRNPTFLDVWIES